MDESKRRAVRFLEKEIKTYMALSLFLSNQGIKEQTRGKKRKILVSPSFYKERMKEAKKIVYELRKESGKIPYSTAGADGACAWRRSQWPCYSAPIFRVHTLY
jgi:hypothetical protein